MRKITLVVLRLLAITAAIAVVTTVMGPSSSVASYATALDEVSGVAITPVACNHKLCDSHGKCTIPNPGKGHCQATQGQCTVTQCG